MMRIDFADQYGCPCVVIDGTEAFEDVETKCSESEALYFDGDEYCMVVQFPDRFPELYTGDALRRSLASQS